MYKIPQNNILIPVQIYTEEAIVMAGYTHDQQSGASQPQVVVVMVPFVAQGHLNQLLHLSRFISAYGIPVHFITTTTHSRQAKLRIHGWNPLSDPRMHFHEIETPSFEAPPPDPNAPTKFPTHLQPLFEASLNLREPVAELLQAISPTAKRVVVIHDSLMTYVVQDVVSVPNAKAYVFRALSYFYLFWFNWEKLGRPFEVEPEIQNHAPAIDGSFTQDFMNFLKIQSAHQNFHSGILFDSSRVIEGKYVDLFARVQEISGRTKHWAIGPFNPVEVHDNRADPNRHKCLEWLDKQEPNSVIYVSFGTTTSFTNEEIRALAIGLEESEQKFLWVLRDADKGDGLGEDNSRVELPKGYEERVKGKGMISRDWVPQPEVLGHPSTGGFMSHCGWNSTMESITMGVPMATWPMHSDQPGNAVLVTKVLKIGLVVKGWENRCESTTPSTIANVVRRLIASEEGAEMRRRAAALGEAVKKSVEEGGVTRTELDSFIAHISR